VKQVGPKGPPPMVNPLADLAVPPEEMIHLPPKPDSNITHVWPVEETFRMDYKTFSAIYPNYLDSNKTVKHGRRISASDAIPEPSVYEIGWALQALNIRHAVQPHKGYSRDAESRWDNEGRVLVDMDAVANALGSVGDAVIMGNDGAFDVDDMPNVVGDEETTTNGASKKALCRRLARIIPTLAARKRRMEDKKRDEEEEKKAREKYLAQAKLGGGKGKSGGTGGGGGNQGGTNSKKKKGKKKR